MNKQLQTLAAWLGAAVAVAMLVFPPWMRPAGQGLYHGEGYALIWNPPTENAMFNTSQLLTQLAVVALVIGVAIATLKDKE